MDTYDILAKHNEIVFYFAGELGWEVCRLSGAIRWFKLKFPNKKIIVYSRPDRYDLYHDCIDLFVDLNIDNEHNYQPNCYRLDKQLRSEYVKTYTKIKKAHPNAFIFNPAQYGCKRDVFDFEKMDFNYTPRENNSVVIDNLLKKHPNKIPLVIPSRHRYDISLRNWGYDRWQELFKLLEDNGRYLILLAGKSPSMVRPPDSFECFECLEDYVNEDNSLIGLTLESVFKCRYVVGSQTAVTIMAGLVKTPQICWGGDRIRHVSGDNPYGTEVIFLDDPEYKLEPSIIYDEINNLKLIHTNQFHSPSKLKRVVKKKKRSNIKPYDVSIIKQKKHKKKKIIGVIGAFDKGFSTNIQISKAFNKNPNVDEVYELDYRMLLKQGKRVLNESIIDISHKCDVLFICKGNGITTDTIKSASLNCIMYLWFMDWFNNITGHPTILDFSKYFDFRSATSFETSELWGKAIDKKVHHVLDGATTGSYYPEDIDKIYDVTFIGSNDSERSGIYELLKRNNINVKFFGPGFTQFVHPDEFRRICNQSKICLNISRGAEEGYSSVRLWNLLSTGAFVVTKKIPNMEKHLKLKNEIHIAEFETESELITVLKYYLSFESVRTNISNTSYKYVLNNQRWDNVIERVINIINNDSTDRY